VAVVDPTQLVGVERQVVGPILVVAVERAVVAVDSIQLVGVERRVAGPILVVAVEKEAGTAEVIEAAVPILVVVGVEVVEVAVPRLVEVAVGIGSSSAGAVERLIAS
jgi:hypothetical protein